MTELKTLKDIKGMQLFFRPDKSEKLYGENDRLIGEKELKAEAIKWVKKMDIKKSSDYCDGMMDFIINFFNLTEENLKDDK